MGEYRRGQREGRPAWYAGFPRWRKRGVHDSYQVDNGRGNVGVAGWLARLPRVGWLRMRDTLRFSGEPIIVVVANDGIRRYVTIGVYTGRAGSPKRDGEAIGFYMEVRTLATLSDGTVEENPRALASALLALRRADRAIARSRNTCGHSRSPNRRNRLYTRRRRLQVRIAYLRHDFQHKATTAIANRYARIGVETLNVSGMMRNRRLSRGVADADMGSFITMVEYKSELYGAELIWVDRWYASSNVRSGCGSLKAAMRDYRYHACGLVMDRDEHAAVNIVNEVARSADSRNGRGNTVSPGWTTSPAMSVKRRLGHPGRPVRFEHVRADPKDLLIHRVLRRKEGAFFLCQCRCPSFTSRTLSCHDT